MTTIMGIAQPIIIDLGEDEERGEWVAAVRGGWGGTEYLQLDWMDDKTNGWMEKASRPRHPLYKRISFLKGVGIKLELFSCSSSKDYNASCITLGKSSPRGTS
jgi:hypothetical protein